MEILVYENTLLHEIEAIYQIARTKLTQTIIIIIIEREVQNKPPWLSISFYLVPFCTAKSYFFHQKSL